ncbi:MAG TPA: Sec-independent protein translocase protein TatB [Geminicoccus sp.]|jgi:sec-independent protein translocase protein TatB|uniref:Sec-independent protein translocase protein TatB n=1 Tax=Geminicoccus sp. TaxID=2024832 RepID=UPI002E30A8C2|nr:Sec-independent protein translocase protein TatB [Geminicoccus sp.]HEX2529176.1 Sec-independent protein translocase protein TatB [Geminicoccus sp.]
MGWSEMAIIVVVALVVVGPKDLPRLARTLGQWMAKGRSMAREFQRHIDDMAREAELQDLKESVQKISPAGIRDQITKAVDPDGTLGKSLDTRDIAKSFSTNPIKPTAPPAGPAAAPPAEPAAATPAVTATPAAPVVPDVGPADPVAVKVTETPRAATDEATAKPIPAPVEKA